MIGWKFAVKVQKWYACDREVCVCGRGGGGGGGREKGGKIFKN